MNKQKLYVCIAIFIVVLNVLAWNSTAFCDAYIAYVFPVWVNTYGRITGEAIDAVDKMTEKGVLRKGDIVSCLI